MSYLYIVWGIVIIGLLFKLRKNMMGHAKVFNALHAKHTFASLDDSAQLQTLQRVYEIMRQGGYTEPESRFERFTEVQRNGFIALALSSLGIAPKASTRFPRWHNIQNPQIVPSNIEDVLRGAEGLFYKQNNQKVKLESKHL